MERLKDYIDFIMSRTFLDELFKEELLSYLDDALSDKEALWEFYSLQKDERLIILPVKPGQPFYNPRLTDPDGFERDIREYVFDGHVLIGADCEETSGTYNLPISVFGKTLFVNRDEAEAALDKLKGG